jgi:hypothetical protein
MGKAKRLALEAEMDIIDELTPPKDWDVESEETFSKQARFMDAVPRSYDSSDRPRQRKLALARLVRRGEVVSWRNYGKRANYALAEENARARRVIRRRVLVEYQESFNEQVEILRTAIRHNGHPIDMVKALHKAGYAIVPGDSIRGPQRYLPR